jgi:benzoyl-CoA reductase/2-hydroxyglutaryl-CoA dehydratase subunit BcrC/BadD/HgdB
MPTIRERFEEALLSGEVHRGVIEEFRGSWMSGLATLVISGEPVPCENAPTVRALEAAFGNVIAPGHTVNQEAIRGKEIYWSYDDMGLVLESFTPVDDPRLDEEFLEEVSNGD